MYKKSLMIIIAVIGITLNSCSKKVHPSKTATVIPSKSNTSPETKKPVVIATPPAETKKIDSVETAKAPVVKTKPKTEFPKVITVNDEAASKSVDGRLYYDVMGHRYWKNFKDGKYYLFDKSMYNNPDFKPPR